MRICDVCEGRDEVTEVNLNFGQFDADTLDELTTYDLCLRCRKELYAALRAKSKELKEREGKHRGNRPPQPPPFDPTTSLG
jgi:hypothetical protein